MNYTVSHSFEEETLKEKARWFQTLSLSERMDMLCYFTDMILENNPEIAEQKDVKSITGRIQVIEKS